MESMDLYGLQIMSGVDCIGLGIFIYAYVTYDQVYYDVVYGSLAVFH